MTLVLALFVKKAIEFFGQRVHLFIMANKNKASYSEAPVRGKVWLWIDEDNPIPENESKEAQKELKKAEQDLEDFLRLEKNKK